MLTKSISTERAPRAIGPYSQGVVAGNFLFLSGQVALVPATGSLLQGTIHEEVTQVLDNLKGILEAAGSGLDRVVRTTVYLTSMGDFEAMNEVYGRYFSANRPARSTVQVSALPRGARVEIDAIAVIS